MNRAEPIEPIDPTRSVLPLHPGVDGIELRHLRAFATVADELNFARAADRLYLSAPALSRQIRGLERVIGCDLFRRTTRRVELTLAGDAMLDCARRILADLDDGVAATRAVGGQLSARINAMWEPLVDAVVTGGELAAMRAAIEEFLAQLPKPESVTVLPQRLGGVPTLQLTPPDVTNGVLLYLHGGGHVMGSAFGYQAFVGELAATCAARAVLPDFRLAPEHPFPADLDDARAVYLDLLATGTAPEEITVVGDSAGAGLALSLLRDIDGQRLPRPAGAVLLCPWVDLTCSSYPKDREQPARFQSYQQVRRCADLYLGGASGDLTLLDPLSADLSGLPPTLVHAASDDAMLLDAKRLTDHARSCGVDIHLEIYGVDTHDFHVFWSFLPEAARALQDVAAHLTARRSRRH
ncbi:alpha/beta hydrolase fold domain-containing protein [Actinomycetes bacterium KLBMP 9759]